MGQLKSDGKATQGGFTAPTSEVINFGDLYRLNGWSHIALDSIAAADTVRDYGGEFSSERIWWVLLPSNVDPDVGDYLYWTDLPSATDFQRGDTDITLTAKGAPCAICEAAKNTGEYAAVRVLNVGVSGAS